MKISILVNDDEGEENRKMNSDKQNTTKVDASLAIADVIIPTPK